MKVARIYLRVSTETQDLERQESIIEAAKSAGFYIAGVYRETASGAIPNRPELSRLLNDLQAGEFVLAEKIDRISRLPLPEAEKLINAIKAKGARLAIPGVVDLQDLADTTEGVPKIVLEAVQALLLKLALQMARDDYETRRERQRQGIDLARSQGRYKGRKANEGKNQMILALRAAGRSIADTAKLASCSESHVKQVCAKHKAQAKLAQQVQA